MVFTVSRQQLLFLVFITVLHLAHLKPRKSNKDSSKKNSLKSSPKQGKAKTNIPESEHFCKVLNSTKHIELQALAIDQTQLYLIHADNLYMIPLANLDTKNNVLYMYDRADHRQYWPVKWYEHPDVRVDPKTRGNASVRPRHRMKNSASKLQLWHVFAVDRNHTLPPMQYNLLKSYIFKGKDDISYDEFLIDKATQTILFDSSDNNTVGNPAIDYRFKARHLPFSAVTGGVDTTKGFLFHYDLTNAESKRNNRPKRVLIDRVYKGLTKPGDTDWINFPLSGSSQTGAYMRLALDGNPNRKRTGFKLVAQNAPMESINKDQDFFLYLPFGFIGPHNEVYLFSQYSQRVYRIDYFELSLDTQLPQRPIIQGKSWSEFFICSSNQTVKKDRQLAPEQTQGEYIHLAEEWQDRHPKKNEQWLTIKMMFGLVCIGLLIASVIFVVVMRIRKQRRRQVKAQIAALTSMKPTIEGEVSTSRRNKSTKADVSLSAMSRSHSASKSLVSTSQYSTSRKATPNRSMSRGLLKKKNGSTKERRSSRPSRSTGRSRSKNASKVKIG